MTLENIDYKSQRVILLLSCAVPVIVVTRKVAILITKVFRYILLDGQCSDYRPKIRLYAKTLRGVYDNVAPNKKAITLLVLLVFRIDKTYIFFFVCMLIFLSVSIRHKF